MMLHSVSMQTHAMRPGAQCIVLKLFPYCIPKLAKVLAVM